MEDRKSIWRRVGWIFALLLLVPLSFIIGTQHGKVKAIESLEVGRDTIEKVVPVWKDFPDPVKTVSAGFVALPAYRFLTDTVNRDVNHFVPVYLKDSSDTVFIPREQKYYSEDEGRLRLWVSGVDPRLDRWELDRIETTITETYKPPSKRWGLDLFTGFGGTFTSQPLLNAQAGIELRYEPGRWGFGLLGGYGTNIIDGKLVPAPFVGGRAKLNIINW